MHTCFSLLFLPHIGKSVDPDGTKAGAVVDMNVVDRLIVFLNSHHPAEYPKEKMIEYLTPFIGREEAFLQLTMLLYQNGVENSDVIVNIMNAFPAGEEDAMHAHVHTQLRKKKVLDATRAAETRANAALATQAAAAANAHAAAVIASQPSSSSSLAVAAAAAKNSPSVEHGPVELDVDNEVHGDDDYMPPPDASGNKRELQVEKID
jgi:hypothetical protein